MYSNRASSGKHMICDIKDIRNVDLLDNCLYMKKILENMCVKYNFEILNKVEHKFEPYGFTLLFLLSESHISVHPFPEKNYFSFDIYTCREYKDNSVYEDIYNYLITFFDASSSSTKLIVDRYF